MDSNLTQFKHVASDLSIMIGYIMYGNHVFISVNLLQKTLTAFHYGNPGICAMKSLARAIILYPGMDHDLTDIVKLCKQCTDVSARPPHNSTVEWPKPCRNMVSHS